MLWPGVVGRGILRTMLADQIGAWTRDLVATTVFLTRSQRDEVAEAAARQGRSRSAAIREAVALWLHVHRGAPTVTQ